MILARRKHKKGHKKQTARTHYRSILDRLGPLPADHKEDDKEPRLYSHLYSLMRPKRISWYVGTRCMENIEKEQTRTDKPLIQIPLHGFFAFSTLLIPLELGLRIILNKPKLYPFHIDCPLLTPSMQKASQIQRMVSDIGVKVWFSWNGYDMICELLAEEAGKGYVGSLTLCFLSED